MNSNFWMSSPWNPTMWAWISLSPVTQQSLSMGLYNRETKLSTAILEHPQLIPVVNRLGIMLGVGDMSIGSICANAHIDPDFFLSMVNTFLDKDYFPVNSKGAFLRWKRPWIICAGHRSFTSGCNSPMWSVISILFYREVEETIILPCCRSFSIPSGRASMNAMLTTTTLSFQAC